MRAVAQRVRSASVEVDNKIVSAIDMGLLVFIGIHKEDTLDLSSGSGGSGDYVIRKIVNLRIFADDNGVMNKSVRDIDGEILLVSQFTLYGDCRNGNRPSFMNAMPPEKAKNFYKNFADCLKSEYPKVKEGVFGANMQVKLVNDGPVTILIDSVK